ncbi:MAG: ribosome maturation factor RimM [Candidatus Binatia bacterium]
MSSKSSKKNDLQSPTKRVSLGRTGGPHGVRGELRFLPYAFPCKTLREGVTIFLHAENELPQAYTVEKVRPHPPCLLLKLQGVDSRESAQTLREKTLAVEKDVLPPLQEGEFYYYQVIGLSVYTTSGQLLGSIRTAFCSGGNDIWVVHQGKKEYLIPVTEEIVRTIDIPGGKVVIEPMPGLLD